MTRLNRLIALLALLVLGAGTLSAEEHKTKLIFLGFDGIDPILARQWMDQGELPNMKKLTDAGGFAELNTISPPQSPAAWSSMLNGTNPGKHGVVGFVRRSKDSYAPELGVVRITQREILWGVPGRIGIGLVGLLVVAGISMIALRKKPLRKRCIISVASGALLGGALCYASFWIPQQVPSPSNARVGKSFIDYVSEAGHSVAALNTPMDWPVPQRENVLEYAGFNIPDLRGTFGIYSFYTTSYTAEEFVKSEMGADVSRVRFSRIDSGKEIAQATLLGARDVMNAQEGYPEVPLQFTIQRDVKAKSLTLAFDDRTPFSVKEGEWSAWQNMRFQLSPLVSVSGRFRCYAERVAPELRLYVTPVQMDPFDPAGGNALANPPEFFEELDRRFAEDDRAPMDTLGWPELTHPLYDENLGDSVFMEHVLELERKRAEVLYEVLDSNQHELVSAWFYGSDRVQHMMYRYIDPLNPLHGALQSNPLKDSILEIYHFMDEVVGRVMADHMGDDTLLLIGSDHGFAPFRRSVSLNRWLMDQGYLVLKGTQQKRHASDMFNQKRDQLLVEIDWEKTRAYSLGLGKIFINQRGREPRGIVEPEQSHQLALEIKSKLEALKDPDDPDAKPVNKVYTREEAGIFGPLEEDMADLLIGFSRGYRVSWQTTLGYAGEEVIFDNDRRWSGDHCSIDPALIPGVLFSNRPLAEEAYSLMDLCPTILDAFDLPVPDETDGKIITFKQ